MTGNSIQSPSGHGGQQWNSDSISNLLSKDDPSQGKLKENLASLLRTEAEASASRLSEWIVKQINEATKESIVQEVIEHHPYLLVSRNPILGNSLISQLPLGADLIPDFAYVEAYDHQIFLYLVEIERPTMRIFQDKGDFSQPFNVAMQQLADWHLWARKYQTLLRDMLSDLWPNKNPPQTYIEPVCRLIAGRSNEVDTAQKRSKLEAKIANLGANIFFRTYDDLIKDLPQICFACIGNPDGLKTVSYKRQGLSEK